MNRITRILLLVLVAALCLSFNACGKKEEASVPEVKDLSISHEPEFGGIYIKITIDDFNALGFKYGDSVDVSFSNGRKIEDLPYYNGYYVNAGEALLVGYPGYDYIKVAVNYGRDIWDDIVELMTSGGRLLLSSSELSASGGKTLWQTMQLDGDVTASIVLKERGKYLDIQEARDIHYKDERDQFPSDEVFANFREMTAGNIKPGTLYRSASPCDNQHNRAPYTDRLIADAKVMCILDLADSREKIDRYIAAEDFSSPYFLSLYEADRVIPLALNMNYFSDEFKEKIAEGFTAMARIGGPYLIHCTEGKDRTGFVCMLVEALAGASYQEIIDDYMLTYDNYYKINEEKDKAKYDVILNSNLISMITSVVNDDTVDITKADLSQYARNYLLEAGMTEEALDLFLANITEQK